MRCTIPEITWHNRDPVLSVDVQPKVDDYKRLATCGTDSHVLIWYIQINENHSVAVEIACDLSRHQKAVNVVRWSPSGEYLASGDDESNIILWNRKTENDYAQFDAESEDNKETWLVFKILRGHMDDIYDISWSPDSTQLLSGSVDNTAMFWNIHKGTKHILQADHKGFVQGVAWDPLNQYCATLNSDRVCRVFDISLKKLVSRSSKGKLPVSSSSPLFGQTLQLYHDGTLKSFFRRLTFSPDGSLLITPSGCVEIEQNNKAIHGAYVYIRHSFQQPVMMLPSLDQFTVAVRCCPKLFELREDGPLPLIPLSYRMVIAVATRTSVILYDTQQANPFATIASIHYTSLTDISWSSDGLLLAVSSTDGYCSLITFLEEELGTVYVPKDISKSVNNIECNENIKSNIKVMQSKEIKKNKISNVISIDKKNIGIDEIAQDSWPIEKMEVDQKTETKVLPECKELVDTDEATEDFKLIYEESLLEVKDSLQTNTNEVSKKDNESVQNNSEVKDSLCSKQDEIVNKDVKEIQNNDTDNSTVSDVTLKNNIPLTHTPKTPRRVGFITLSSPKGKKKLL